MSHVTSYTRTQVYLDPDDHRRLRRLAAERDQSMTDLVREAVARYIVDEVGVDTPTMDDMLDELYADERYADLPRGRAGFVARMRARADAGDRRSVEDISAIDRDLGTALFREHQAQRDAWSQRQRRRRDQGGGE